MLGIHTCTCTFHMSFTVTALRGLASGVCCWSWVNPEGSELRCLAVGAGLILRGLNSCVGCWSWVNPEGS